MNYDVYRWLYYTEHTEYTALIPVSVTDSFGFAFQLLKAETRENILLDNNKINVIDWLGK